MQKQKGTKSSLLNQTEELMEDSNEILKGELQAPRTEYCRRTERQTFKSFSTNKK